MEHLFLKNHFYIFLTIIAFTSCNGQYLSRSKLRESSNAYKLSVFNVDSILLDSTKIKEFHKQLIKEYGADVQADFIETRRIVRDSLYKNIGMYSYRRNSAHSPYKLFFLNYADSVVFINERDSLLWNKNIEKFISTYSEQFSQKEKNILREQLLNDK